MSSIYNNKKKKSYIIMSCLCDLVETHWRGQNWRRGLKCVETVLMMAEDDGVRTQHPSGRQRPRSVRADGFFFFFFNANLESC